MDSSDFWKQPKSFLSFLEKLLLARWRSLLLLLLGVGLPLLVFEQLAVVIWQNKCGFPWDEPILLAIHQRGTPQLDAFAARFTNITEICGKSA